MAVTLSLFQGVSGAMRRFNDQDEGVAIWTDRGQSTAEMRTYPVRNPFCMESL